MIIISDLIFPKYIMGLKKKNLNIVFSFKSRFNLIIICSSDDE